MNLQEKFWNIIKKPQTDRPAECGKIADEFAIGFAIWCIDYTYHKSFDVWIKNNNSKVERFTKKELLEIFKNEKKL